MKTTHTKRPIYSRGRAAVAVLTLFVGFPSLAGGETIPVVVTLPVLRDLVQKVGKDDVQVQSLITGLEGEHTYTPKPSDLRAVQKAKLLVTIGLGLETWMDSLIKNADRTDLERVVASDHVSRMNGNPHIWLDPENVKIMVKNIADGLSRMNPAHEAAYRAHEADFMSALNRLTQEMIGAVSKLPATRRKMITHHAAWPYFAKRFGFIIVGEIQTQIGTHGGSEPSAKQIRRLIHLIRAEGVSVIVSEPQLNQKIPDILVEETGARRVVLSPQPGVFPKTDTYLDFMRYNVETLIGGMQDSRGGF